MGLGRSLKVTLQKLLIYFNTEDYISVENHQL
jgi:hypothetical protein